jgi:hypothetical protein
MNLRRFAVIAADLAVWLLWVCTPSLQGCYLLTSFCLSLESFGKIAFLTRGCEGARARATG